VAPALARSRGVHSLRGLACRPACPRVARSPRRRRHALPAGVDGPGPV